MQISKELNSNIGSGTNIEMIEPQRQIVDTYQQVAEFNQTSVQRKPDFRSIYQLGKVIMLENLSGFVLVFFYGMAFYYMVEADPLLLTLQIIADLILIAQMILIVYALINKSKLVKLCILSNFISVLIKLFCLILMVKNPSALLIAPILIILLQAIQIYLYIILIQRWGPVPERKWKKQMMLVRKPMKKEIAQI